VSEPGNRLKNDELSSFRVVYLKTIAIVFFVFLIVAISLGIWWLYFSGPSFDIQNRDKSFVINNLFLGEYGLGFEKIKIVDQNGQKIFESSLRCCEPITLTAGFNEVVSESGEKSYFTLGKNTTYKVTLFGNNGNGYSNPGTITIEF